MSDITPETYSATIDETRNHINALTFIESTINDINDGTSTSRSSDATLEGLLSVSISAISVIASLTNSSQEEVLATLKEAATAWVEGETDDLDE